MSGRDDRRLARRRLALKRETVRELSAADLGRVASGTDLSKTCFCESSQCDQYTYTCGLSTGSRFC